MVHEPPHDRERGDQKETPVIYDLALEVEMILRARKFPVRIRYGPKARGNDRCFLVMSRAPTGDSVDTSTGRQLNPGYVARRGLMAQVLVFAQSSLEGAHIGDHERECEAITDGVIVAIRDVLVSTRLGALDVRESRYLTPEETEAQGGSYPGVVYMVKLNVPRGVYALDYSGQGAPEVTIIGTANTTREI